MFLFVLLVITCSLEFYVGYAQNQQFVAIQEAPIRIHAVPNGVSQLLTPHALIPRRVILWIWPRTCLSSGVELYRLGKCQVL
jgi:hypothetical protein